MKTHDSNNDTSGTNVEVLAGDEVSHESQGISQSERDGNRALEKTPVKSIVMLPFMMFIAVLSAMYRLICNTLGDSSSVFRNFFVLNYEENKILKEVPRQQQRQKKDLHQVAKKQEGQRAQLDDLRRRIEKLEAKRNKSSSASGEHTKVE
mmetsp:Transcript_26382/g.37180  ORF Transcript_26382/g.37180 Transcript_26382/m.37180 type:complete len:150 (+) Transcript_26382:126-575(+)